MGEGYQLAEEMEKRERVQEEIMELGALERGVEIQYSGNFLYSMKVILLLIPSNVGYVVSADHLLSPSKPFSDETEFHSAKLFTLGNLQTTQAISKT